MSVDYDSKYYEDRLLMIFTDKLTGDEIIQRKRLANKGRDDKIVGLEYVVQRQYARGGIDKAVNSLRGALIARFNITLSFDTARVLFNKMREYQAFDTTDELKLLITLLEIRKQ